MPNDTIIDNIHTLASTIGTEIQSLKEDKANLSGATFTGNVVTKGCFGTVVAMSGANIDLSTGTVFTKTISEAITLTFNNVTSGKNNCFSLILTNGGSATVTWPNSVRWAGGTAPDLTSSGVDVITFLTPDGGSTWHGVPSSLDSKASS